MVSIARGVSLSPTTSSSDRSARSSEESAADNGSLPTPSKTTAQLDQHQRPITPTSTPCQTSDPALPARSQARRDPVHAISEWLLQIAKGDRGQEWESYRLTPLQWEKVQILAKKALQLDKIRHDYDPVRRRLILRMPSAKHDLSALEASTLVLNSLRNHLGETQSEGIFATSTSDIKFPSKAKKSPDCGIANLSHLGYPVFVLEIGYSNKPTPELAEDYMCMSEGHIRTVFCFNLKYAKDTVKAHEIIIYRLKEEADAWQCDDSAVYLLRSYHENGACTDYNGSVRLYPSDFGIHNHHTPFDIPFAKFLNIADEAEARQQKVFEPQSPSLFLNKPFRKRNWRTPTPEEESDEVSSPTSSQDPTYEPPRKEDTEQRSLTMTTRSKA